jgi:hypothetical protein
MIGPPGKPGGTSVNGSVAWNKRVSATISRNGDLITNAFLEIVLQKGAGQSYYPAEALIKEVEMEIGGQRIDKHTSTWFRVYSELFRKSDEKSAYQRMTDFVDGEAPGTQKRFYLPLIFFWNLSPGLALPLIALMLQGRKAPYSGHSSSGVRQGSCSLEARRSEARQTQVLVAC